MELIDGVASPLLREEVRGWTTVKGCCEAELFLVTNERVACCWRLGDELHKTLDMPPGTDPLFVTMNGHVAAVRGSIARLYSLDGGSWSFDLEETATVIAPWGQDIAVGTSRGRVYLLRPSQTLERLGSDAIDSESLIAAAAPHRRGLVAKTMDVIGNIGSYSARKLFRRQSIDDDVLPESSTVVSLDRWDDVGIVARADGVAQLWSDTTIAGIHDAPATEYRFAGDVRLQPFKTTPPPEHHIVVAVEENNRTGLWRIVTYLRRSFAADLSRRQRDVRRPAFEALHAVEFPGEAPRWSRLRLQPSGEDGWLLDQRQGHAVAPLRLSSDARLSVGTATLLENRCLDLAPVPRSGARNAARLICATGDCPVVRGRAPAVISDDTRLFQDEPTSSVPEDWHPLFEDILASIHDDDTDGKEVIIDGIPERCEPAFFHVAVATSKRIVDAPPVAGWAVESGDLAGAFVDSKARRHSRFVAALRTVKDFDVTAAGKIATDALHITTAVHLCREHTKLQHVALTEECRALAVRRFDTGKLQDAGLSALDAYYGQPPSRCLDAVDAALSEDDLDLVHLAATALDAGKRAYEATTTALCLIEDDDDDDEEIRAWKPDDVDDMARKVLRRCLDLLVRAFSSVSSSLTEEKKVKLRELCRLSCELMLLYSEEKADDADLAVDAALGSARISTQLQEWRKQSEAAFRIAERWERDLKFLEVCLAADDVDPDRGLGPLEARAAVDSRLADVAVSELTKLGRFADALAVAQCAEEPVTQRFQNHQLAWLTHLRARDYGATLETLPAAPTFDAVRALTAYASNRPAEIPNHRLKITAFQTNVLRTTSSDLLKGAEALVTSSVLSDASSSRSDARDQLISLARIVNAAADLADDDSGPIAARLWAVAASKDADAWTKAASKYGTFVVDSGLRRTTFLALCLATNSVSCPSPPALEAALTTAAFAPPHIVPRLATILLAAAASLSGKNP